jgi:regulator of CtrA degradation
MGHDDTLEPSGLTAFFDRTYEEAMILLVESRDYITANSRLERDAVVDQLNYSLETTRLTARLTEIMAWILTQKAVHAGEISRADACLPERRLSAREVCLQDNPGAALPPYFQSLLTRSRDLYRRVERLDEMIDRGPSVPELPQI